MQGETKERWQELCELAAKEQDPEKLSALVAEIDRMLQEKEDRLKRLQDQSQKFFPPSS